ncbi:MAG: inositol monophosphatase family protein [bacterium]
MKEIEVLKKTLLDGGKVMLRDFGKVSYSLKGRSDLLTRADVESQTAVLNTIKKVFPGHDYLAEENSKKITGSRFIWVIDPLDGTTNYAHGFPTACVSVGLLKDGKPFAGGIFDPFRKELFLAAKGKGAFLNGRRIKVSSENSLSASLLLTGFAYDRAKKAEFYCSFYADFIKICHDVRRSGSAALDMAWTAAGRTDGYWEFSLNPWDVCAGRILVEEAGGKVTDFSDRQWGGIFSWGKQTLASNGKIHGQMLRVIRQRLGDRGEE